MQYRLAALLLVFGLAACGGGASGTNASNNPLPAGPSNTDASNVMITEYSLGSSPSAGGITIAKDGSVWTASEAPTPSFVRWFNGAVSTYPLPASPAGQGAYQWLGMMVSSPSAVFGATLRNEGGGNYVNDIFGVPLGGGTPEDYGNAEFPTGSGTSGSLAGVTSMSDGSVWEAISLGNVGCCSGQGTLQEVTPGKTAFALPENQDASGNFTYSLPTALAQGPDGNLWVSVQNWENSNGSQQVLNDSMLVYSETGTLLHTFALPIQATSMVTGPDNALWFTQYNGSIGRMSASGSVQEYPTNTTTALGEIAKGGDGALWFLEPNVNRVARMTTSGSESDYAIPTANSGPDGIAGPPPNCPGGYVVWFAEANSGKIAMVGYK